MLLKFPVTVVESLIVTAGPCVTRVAYSNSGQPKPQLRSEQSPPQQRNHKGVGMQGERVPPQAPPQGEKLGGEDTMCWGGERGVAALHLTYMHTYRHTPTYMHSCIHTYTATPMPTCIVTNIHAFMHVCTHT